MLKEAFLQKFYELCGKYASYCRDFEHDSDEAMKLLQDVQEYEDFVKKYFDITFD